MDTYAWLKLLISLGALVALIALGFVVYKVVGRLRRRWGQTGFTKPARNREIAILVVSVLLAIQAVSTGTDALNTQVAQSKARAQGREATRLAAIVHQKLADDLQARRPSLIEETQRQVSRGKVSEARADLARYAALRDPQVTQMIGLLDVEIEVAQLTAKVKTEIPASQMATAYKRLAQLAPGVPNYKAQSERYAALAQKEDALASAKAREQVVQAGKQSRESSGPLIGLLARVEPGRELYLASDGSYIGTIIDVLQSYRFPDGSVEPAILVSFANGDATYIPRATATRIYKTRQRGP